MKEIREKFNRGDYNTNDYACYFDTKESERRWKKFRKEEEKIGFLYDKKHRAKKKRCFEEKKIMRDKFLKDCMNELIEKCGIKEGKARKIVNKAWKLHGWRMSWCVTDFSLNESFRRIINSLEVFVSIYQ
jgi:hypothetical protein